MNKGAAVWLLATLAAGLLALAWHAERRAARDWRPTPAELNRLIRSLGLPVIRTYRPDGGRHDAR